MVDLTHTLALRGVTYQWGGKSNLTLSTGRIPQSLDCSGFSAELVYYASSGKVEWPAGSLQQREHCQGFGRPEVLRWHKGQYVKAIKNRRAVLVCFIDPTTEHAGHVWFVIDGWTCESYGGHGVGRRPAETPVLVRECNWVFVLDA